MKKILCVLLVFMCVVTSVNIYAVTMYAPDGRTISVKESEVIAWKKVGWYTIPVMRAYTSDGRISIIPQKDYESWNKVGWYSKPVVTVYATDGRERLITASEYPAWFATGWSLSKTQETTSSGLVFRNSVEKKRVTPWQDLDFKTNTGTTISNKIVPDVNTMSATDKKEFMSNGAYIEYNLGGRYSLFCGTFAVKEYTGEISGAVQMKIYLDGVEVFATHFLDYKSIPVKFGIKLNGCNTLRVKFIPVSGNENVAYFAGDFALGDAVIYK